MRAAGHLFNRARQIAPDTLSIRLSVLEIYNESLTDLLRPESSASTATGKVSTSGTSRGVNASNPSGEQAQQKLSIIDTPSGVIIPSLFILPLSSEEDAYSMLLESYSNRVVAEHQLNRRSSRSSYRCSTSYYVCIDHNF